MSLTGRVPKDLNSSQGQAWLRQFTRMPGCFFFDGETHEIADASDEPSLYEFKIPPSVFRRVGDEVVIRVGGFYQSPSDNGTRNYRAYINGVAVAALSYIALSNFTSIGDPVKYPFVLETRLTKLSAQEMCGEMEHKCSNPHAPGGTTEGHLSFLGTQSDDLIDESATSAIDFKITVDVNPAAVPVSSMGSFYCKAAWAPGVLRA